MDFALTEEQQALREVARDWFAVQSPLERVAVLTDADPGWDPGTWAAVQQMGWLDADLGPVEQALVLEQAGYAAHPGPLSSTLALAGPLGGGTGRSATATWETGELMTTAHAPHGAASSVLVSGSAANVPDLSAAELVVVGARTAGGDPALALVAVDGAAGVTVTPRSSTDRGRRLADLTLAGALGQVLVSGPDALAAVSRARPHALALLAAEAVGVAQRALDLAVAHAKTREQFDRPIGSYQAVAHPLADVYTAVELGRSLAYRAAWCVAEGDPDATTAALAAKAHAGPAAVQACERAIQTLGGLGFTWEAQLHRLYKRAQTLATEGGSARPLRRELADALLGPVAGAAPAGRRWVGLTTPAADVMGSAA